MRASAGDGPPLVLLHGYPQSHAMWRRVAPELARRFTLVIPDLRGYGGSSVPASHNGERYSKRVMGADIVALMKKLGHERFRVAGHDRGGRVAYRLAFDHPERIEKLATLDIVPTGRDVVRRWTPRSRCRFITGCSSHSRSRCRKR